MTATAGTLTGALTFLFTDLEGSTRTWEHDAAAMDRWLAAHDAILMRAVEAGGGRMFKHTGDGVCAVFTSAAAAGSVALDIQEALAAEGAAVGSLRVRVALHRGEAFERDGDYYGPTLNRCARLLEIAHGGQVLLSAPVAALLDGAQLGDGARLSDLGLHRLRDLQQPERVWQLGAAGRAEEFPPLRSLDSFTHNLPLQRSTFVGREEERRAVSELLAAHRLTTITGVGGCGKTRLALEAAAQLVERYSGGVFFADLSTQTEPALVAATIVGALRLPGGAAGAEACLVEFLAERRALLVLDNCEHLLDACAATADRLLASCPELRILATSRESLNLEGERVWRVPSFGLPAGEALDEVAAAEAVRLFVDRATAVRPDFVLTADNAASVAGICRRLDGIPLAIELAAARVAHLAPHEVEARLSDRFRLLSGGRRGVQRQQTLQAVLDWSHDLLGEPERVLLRRLSVFGGGWTLEAAQEICAGGELAGSEMIDLLGSLVGRSLVDPQDCGTHTRYRLLETVRLYAQDRLLAAGEADALRRTHAEWFLARAAREARGGPWFPPIVSATLDAELDNLCAATDWWRDAGRIDHVALLAASMINELHAKALFDRVETWLEISLHGPQELPAALRARCLGASAIAAEMRGDFLEANRRAEAAIAIAEQPADAGGAYGLLASNLTWFVPKEAERLLESAEAWAAPLGSSAPAYIAALRATLACARYDYDRAAALVAEVGDAAGTGIFTGPTGGVAITARVLHGDLDGAEALLRKVRVGVDRWPRYYLSLLQVVIDGHRGNTVDGRRHLAEAVALSRQWKIPLAPADGVLGCVAIAYHSGRIERAAELLASVKAATGGALRSPMSMCLYRYYRREVHGALDAETLARARAAGSALSLDAALDRELEGATVSG